MKLDALMKNMQLQLRVRNDDCTPVRNETLIALLKLVEEQKDDDYGLNFVPDNVIEGFYQQEIRKLHKAVEEL